MDNTATHHPFKSKWDFRKVPILWGMCFGGYSVLAAYWLVSAPQMGTPLGKFGDMIAALIILILVAALFAGIFSLLLWGLERIQRRLAKAILTGFLEASLREDENYRLWFHDLRSGMKWLPQDIYIHAYQDSSFNALEDYENWAAAKIRTKCFGGMTCTQRSTTLRFYDKPQSNAALLLSWSRDAAGKAAYVLDVQTDVPVRSQSAFVFSLATDGTPANLGVEFLDRNGSSVRFELDQIGPLHPALPTRLFRFSGLAKRLGYKEPVRSETMFQTYEIPLEMLEAADPDIELGHIVRIVFHADADQAGSVWLDEIGFRSTPEILLD